MKSCLRKILLFSISSGILLCGCAGSTSHAGTTRAPTCTSTETMTERVDSTQAVPDALYIDPILPDDFRDNIVNDSELILTDDRQIADLELKVVSSGYSVSQWVYVLVAPFRTIRDNVSSLELAQTWQGSAQASGITLPIYMAQETRDVLSAVLGEPGENVVQIIPEDEVIDANLTGKSWAILPFERLNPQWKVIRIDGENVLEKAIDPQDYFLTVSFGLSGDEAAMDRAERIISSQGILFPASNRLVDRMATVILTGTTALTRDTGAVMDALGAEYPAVDILGWLQSADVLHISHEISFMPDCDLADRLKFCAKTDYFRLLEYVGADVIELTGNHLLDYGEAPFLYSLDLYHAAGMKTYGGGRNLSDAGLPLLMESNGNKLAFLGCNVPGPESVWATATSGGAYRCTRDWIQSTIRDLRDQGYNVIMTFQDLESCDVQPSTAQKGDFIFAAEAGATIVSGSQAHCPQSMEFSGGAFLHYGLGNLFFDQMDSWQSQEFIDRYTFYGGRLLSIELLSAKLEEGAKPRPMSEAERENFLYRIFYSEVQ